MTSDAQLPANGSEDHVEHRREVADLDLLYAFDVPTIVEPEDAATMEDPGE